MVSYPNIEDSVANMFDPSSAGNLKNHDHPGRIYSTGPVEIFVLRGSVALRGNFYIQGGRRMQTCPENESYWSSVTPEALPC